ncbi:MAG: PRC-barrel domain-containing protein [Acetobacteraceae bacterium]
MIGAVGVSMFLAGPVFAAQTTTPPAPTNPPAARIATPNPQANNEHGPTGSLEKSHGEWRASKLVGATVYNDSGDNIGSIDDLLVNNSGKIDTAIVSVGGFLGIGSKLVAVPFDKFKFEQSQNEHAAARPAQAVPATPAPRPVNATASENEHAAAAKNAAPVQYSILLPQATKDSLKSAPSFKY